ncbi:MAG: HU family DNA-binding protein [Nannocystaceae bacterium]
MTRKELVTALRDHLASGEHGPELARLRLVDLDALVGLLFDVITRTLADEGRFSLPGFGTFTVATRGARPGRNPRTGEAIVVDARQVVSFTPGTRLKEIL